MAPVRRDLTVAILLGCNQRAHEFFVSNVRNTETPKGGDILDRRNRQIVDDAECVYDVFDSLSLFARKAAQ